MTTCQPILQPIHQIWIACPHAPLTVHPTQVWALTAKTLMVLNMAIFAGQLYIQSVIMCLTTLSLCYLYIRWVSQTLSSSRERSSDNVKCVM
jgi:hypothetical protein